MMTPDGPIDVVFCDLDGVVWLADEPIPGAVEALEDIRGEGCRIVFVTNNSRSPIGTVVERLRAIGLGGDLEVVSSATAAAGLLGGDDRVLVVGGPGVVEALDGAGCEVVLVEDLAARERETARRSSPSDSSADMFDAVVVGLHTGFDYTMMRLAADVIRAGARFIATNTDPTYPTPSGAVPGAGSVVAAIRTASGVEPEVAGKPNPGMVGLIKTLFDRDLDPDRILVIGDRRSTDGVFAQRIGCRFAWVTSGVEEIHDGDDVVPTIITDDLAALMIHYGHLFRR